MCGLLTKPVSGRGPSNSISDCSFFLSCKLKGLAFLFTGSLDSYSRSEAKKQVKAQSGEVTVSASDRVDYLVVGENPGSKLNQAKKKGIKIINEKGFKQLLAR